MVLIYPVLELKNQMCFFNLKERESFSIFMFCDTIHTTEGPKGWIQPQKGRIYFGQAIKKNGIQYGSTIKKEV